MPLSNGPRDDDSDVELGREVTTRRRTAGSPIVAVRISSELLAALSRLADANGTTVSEMVRRGAVMLVARGANGPTYVTGTLIVHDGVTLQGLPASGNGRSIVRDWENSELALTTSE